jgi:glc operon protein GlcG
MPGGLGRRFRMLGSAAVLLVLAQAVAAGNAGVQFYTPDQVAASLKGAPAQPGLEMGPLAKQATYSALYVRRTAPGLAEVHEQWADVWYVVRGSATLVTGGTLVEGAPTDPGEIRGKGIKGGEERPLKGGEVAVIPAGVPHWISTIKGEVVYLVVKAPKAP